MSASESTGAHETTAALPSVPSRDVPDTSHGSVLGRYLVIEELGRGGMGVVLRAYDPKLQREVALKILRHEVLSDEARVRSIREARAMAKLNHRNVVAIYDVSLDEDAIALAMEYVPGTTLRQWLRDERRSVTAILSAFVQAGRGLAAAHAVGMLHRDFKPANVLVSDAGHLRVKVTDFGLARVETTNEGPISVDVEAPDLLVRSEDTDSGALTEVGTVIGTPRYMAPEQHAGGELGPAADQYAFCIALWEALCDEAPFTGNGFVQAKHCGPPAWPRGVIVPRGVAAALRRGLAPDPHARWPDMDALLAALVAHRSTRARSRLGALLLAGATTSAFAGWAAWSGHLAGRCTGGEAQLADVWSPERRADVEAALLATNASYAPELWTRIGPALDGWTADWVAMHGDACTSSSIRGEQSAAVLDLRMACLHRAKRDLAAMLVVLDRADTDVVRRAHVLVQGLPRLSECADIEALQAEVPPPPPEHADAVARAETGLADARALRRAGKPLEAIEALDAATTEVTDIGYGPIAEELEWERAALMSAIGRHEEAESSYHAALRLAIAAEQWDDAAEIAGETASELGLHLSRPTEGLVFVELEQVLADRSGDPRVLSTAHMQRALVQYGAGKYAEAEEQLRIAIDVRTRALGPDEPGLDSLRNNYAILLHHTGKYAAAEAEHLEVLRRREAALGPEHPDVATSHHNLAATLNAMARPQEAMDHYREALRIWEKTLGAEHPEVLKSRNNLGNVLNGQGRYVESEELLREVVRAWTAARGADHPDVAIGRNNLANALLGQGRNEEALAEYRAVLELRLRVLGADHPDVAHARANVGLALQAMRRYADAEAEYRVAIAERTRTLGPAHEETLLVRARLAEVMAIQGRAGEAEAELRAVLGPFETAMGADHPDTANLRRVLAMALAEQGRDDEAERELRSSFALFEAKPQARPPDRVATLLELGGFLREHGNVDEALPMLEQAWTVMGQDGDLDVVRAHIAFELARCLRASGRDRSRARALARRAEASFAAAGERWAEDRAEVTSWLRGGE